jgi:hypothetical protein
VETATFYTVSWRRNVPGANWTNATVSGAATSFQIPGLTAGSWQFRVRSRCGTVFGAWSATANFVFGAAGRWAQTETEMTAEMTAYPNPNKGDFELRLSGSADATGELSLFDASGRLVFQKRFVPENGAVEVRAGLAVAGTYRLVWKTQNNQKFATVVVAR